MHVFEYLDSEPLKLYACVCRCCISIHRSDVASVKSGMNAARHGALVAKIRQHAEKLRAFLL